MAQTTEAVEPPAEDDDKTTACPEEPSLGFTNEEVAETGLSLELLCVVYDTYLLRSDPPSPNESPDLLRHVLQRGPYQNLSNELYQRVMEEAVRLWPQSHYAHQGLAEALLGSGDSADKRRAADEFLKAADIGFEQGKVLYVIEIQLPQLLAELGDKENLDRYYKQMFKLQPEGEDRYGGYLAYAQALARLGDEQAEVYFQKAIAVGPMGVSTAYELY